MPPGYGSRYGEGTAGSGVAVGVPVGLALGTAVRTAVAADAVAAKDGTDEGCGVGVAARARAPGRESSIMKSARTIQRPRGAILCKAVVTIPLLTVVHTDASVTDDGCYRTLLSRRDFFAYS